MVRDQSGAVLGLFNTGTLQPDRGVGTPIANFALAGKTLIIDTNRRLWTLVGRVCYGNGEVLSLNEGRGPGYRM